MDKFLLLGAEAIAQGAVDGGMSGIYAYPVPPGRNPIYSWQSFLRCPPG